MHVINLQESVLKYANLIGYGLLSMIICWL